MTALMEAEIALTFALSRAQRAGASPELLSKLVEVKRDLIAERVKTDASAS